MHICEVVTESRNLGHRSIIAIFLIIQVAIFPIPNSVRYSAEEIVAKLGLNHFADCGYLKVRKLRRQRVNISDKSDKVTEKVQYVDTAPRIHSIGYAADSATDKSDLLLKAKRFKENRTFARALKRYIRAAARDR